MYMCILLLTGCTKSVEDEKLSVKVNDCDVIGIYSGEVKSNKPSGEGVFSGNDSLTAVGKFEEGKLVSGTVDSMSMTLSINNNEITGDYSGNYDNGVNGKGKFLYQSGSKQLVIEGEFKDGMLLQAQVKELPVSIDLSGTSHDGVYSGTIKDGKITGTGEFKSDEVNYIGEFENGKFSGSGELRKSTIIIHFKDVDRKGTYDGTTVNGLPEGNGSFTAKNDSGNKYTYTGEWKNGLYHGQGVRKFNKKSFEVETGTFVDGVFAPTVKDVYITEGTFYQAEYGVNDKAGKVLDDCSDLFVGKRTNEILKQAKKMTNKKLTYNKFKSDPQEHGDELMCFSGTVNQVLKEEYDGYPRTYVIVSNGEKIYNITFLVENIKIKEGEKCTICGLPLDYFTYKTVSNYNMWAIKIAGVYVK